MSGEWKTIMGPEEQEIYLRAGYGADVEPGAAPALLIIDATVNFTDETPLPILESIERYPNSCGSAAWDALRAMAELLPVARERGVPVVYTHGPVVKNALTLGGWAHTRTRGTEDALDTDGERFVDLIAPEPTDLVLEKYRPSVFCATPLASVLMGLGCDTVLACGGTTSGCVRASVIDSFSAGFRTIVVEEATFDRGRTSHLVNLFEMNQKYSQVWTLRQTLDYLTGIRAADREVASVPS